MWTWSLIFITCAFIELFWRRGYFLWLALVAGFNALVLTQATWFLSISFFVAFGSVATILWHLYIRRPLQVFEQDNQGRDPKKYLHHVFELMYPIQQGRGKTLLDGSFWYLACDQDLPSGTTVKVVRISGVVLYITSV